MKDQINTIREGIKSALEAEVFVDKPVRRALLDAIKAARQLEAMVGEQEPKFWYRPVGDDGLYEGPVHNNSIGGKMLRDEKPGEWVPLFEGAAPVAQQYEAADMASAAAQGFRDGVASVAQQPAPSSTAEYEQWVSDGRPVAQQPQTTCKTCGRRMNDPTVFHGPNGCFPNRQPQAAKPLEPLEPATSYVQPVPDHCDRIVWRNRYYHLPLKQPQAETRKADVARTCPFCNEEWVEQPQARPDFADEWTGYLKDGETPFERFLRERKDMQSVLKLYQRVLEENERLKAQQPQAEPFGYVSQHTNGSWEFSPTAAGVYPDTAKSITAVYTKQPQAEPDDEILKERDDAEGFIDMLLDEVLGTDRPEWTSAYGRDDALRDVQERMTALHKPTVDKAWDRFEKAQQQAEAVQYTSADIDRAYSAGLVEGERLAIQQAEAVPTDADLDSIIEKHLHSYWQYGALEQDRLRALARTLIATKAAPQQAEAVPPGYVLVPVEPTEEMLLSARDWSDTKYGKPIGDEAAKGCWGTMLAAAIAQQKGQP